jgi:hypothetical protein
LDLEVSSSPLPSRLPPSPSLSPFPLPFLLPCVPPTAPSRNPLWPHRVAPPPRVRGPAPPGGLPARLALRPAAPRPALSILAPRRSCPRGPAPSCPRGPCLAPWRPCPFPRRGCAPPARLRAPGAASRVHRARDRGCAMFSFWFISILNLV